PCRTPLARCVRLRVHKGRSRMSGSHAMSGGGMVYAIVAQVLSLLVDLLSGGRRSEQAKELEILVLRQQLRVLQRTQAHPPQPSRWEKRALAVLTAKLKEVAQGVCSPWRQSLLLFTPETILRWHRDLVRRKWTFRHRRIGGRPRTSSACTE